MRADAPEFVPKCFPKDEPLNSKNAPNIILAAPTSTKPKRVRRRSRTTGAARQISSHDECARHSANQQYSLKQPSVLKSHNELQLEKVNKRKAQRKSQTKNFNNNHDKTDSKTPRKKTNKNDFTKPSMRNERSNRRTPSSRAIEDPKTSLVTEERFPQIGSNRNKVPQSNPSVWARTISQAHAKSLYEEQRQKEAKDELLNRGVAYMESLKSNFVIKPPDSHCKCDESHNYAKEIFVDRPIDQEDPDHMHPLYVQERLPSIVPTRLNTTKLKDRWATILKQRQAEDEQKKTNIDHSCEKHSLSINSTSDKESYESQESDSDTKTDSSSLSDESYSPGSTASHRSKTYEYDNTLLKYQSTLFPLHFAVLDGNETAVTNLLSRPNVDSNFSCLTTISYMEKESSRLLMVDELEKTEELAAIHFAVIIDNS